jgi:rhodanese-related sulfurtransferase
MVANQKIVTAINEQIGNEFSAMLQYCAIAAHFGAESRSANDSPLYVLCESGNRAKKAAEKFAASGFAHCVVIEGGTKAWAAAGLPVVCGRQTISLERQVRIGAGALVLTGGQTGASYCFYVNRNCELPGV